ncbi:MAG: leucine-rich repeat protein [Muribaculaceae bacterium]|nr:leucine-rich repeat protein [Muribaculaceae bacterium]
MFKRFYLLALLLATVLHLQAATVTSTAGKLSTVVTYHDTHSLTVNGTLDARDFLFIADELHYLRILDLSNATIVAYNSTLSDGLLPGEYRYAANTLPYCALAGIVRLETVILPTNLTAIDYGAFAGCPRLTEITFPASLKTIGDDAFNSCLSLKQLTIANNINHLGSKAFAHCSSLTTLVINPNGDIEIGDEAFADCRALNNVTIGNTVTALGNGTFNNCISLKKINILPGSNLEDIGDMTFYRSGIEELDLEYTPHLKHLGAWALAKTKLKNFILPTYVKSLDEGTLFYTKTLTTLELPKNLSYLPDYMLAGCDHIKGTPFMTQNMGHIGDFAIFNQSQHPKITVPQRVYYIGTHAMSGITELREITSEPLKVPELGDNVWAGINQSQVMLHVKEESLNDYRAASQWQDFLVDVAQLRGDVNSDGFVNTIDATCLRRYLIEGITEGINLNRTDVASNGRTDIADIVAIYNIINGVKPADYPSNLWFEDDIEALGAMTATRKANIEISLNNTINYTAFQFDITTPSHITIEGATLSSRCLGHEVYVGKVEDNLYRLLCFSPASDDIEGYNGLLVTLNVSSTQNISNNEQITLRRIYFADYQENVYYNNNLDINIIGNSAIENITADDNDIPVNVYNTQGQLLRQNVLPSQATNGLPAGIYLVGGKKVIVK